MKNSCTPSKRKRSVSNNLAECVSPSQLTTSQDQKISLLKGRYKLFESELEFQESSFAFSKSSLVNEDCHLYLSSRNALIDLLSNSLPFVKAARATEALLERYGNYAEAVSAPAAELLTIPSLGSRGANLLGCIHKAVTHLTSVSVRKEPILSDWSALVRYLNVTHARQKKEVFRILYMDLKRYLLADEILANGIETWVEASAREMIKRALHLGAFSIVLIHNHPSGDPTPSPCDYKMTQELTDICCQLRITVLDHIIVGRGQIHSMDQNQSFFT